MDIYIRYNFGLQKPNEYFICLPLKKNLLTSLMKVRNAKVWLPTFKFFKREQVKESERPSDATRSMGIVNTV